MHSIIHDTWKRIIGISARCIDTVTLGDVRMHALSQELMVDRSTRIESKIMETCSKMNTKNGCCNLRVLHVARACYVYLFQLAVEPVSLPVIMFTSASSIVPAWHSRHKK